jgi:hypothetical protein
METRGKLQLVFLGDECETDRIKTDMAAAMSGKIHPFAAANKF